MNDDSKGSAPAPPGFPPADEATWQAEVEQTLAGADFKKTLVTPTPWGGEVRPVYGAESVERILGAGHPTDPSGFPGVAPFVRGGHTVAVGSRPWNLCPRYDHPRLQALNQAILADLEGGADAVWLQFDRASRLGIAPGNDQAAVADEGSPLHTVADLTEVFTGVHPAMIAVTLDAGANALPAAALWLAFLRGQDLDVRELELDLFADPWAALARDGALPGPLPTLENEAALLAAYCRDHLPCARALAASTLPWHDAGAHAAQELGLALAAGLRHLRVLEGTGWTPAEAAGQITFVVAVGRDFFEGMARLRALRLLWARLLEQCGVSDPSPARIHAVTAQRELSRRDPWVNMLRVTTQTFAAVAGGAEIITSASFDEALGQPDSLGRRVARNTQIILAEESRLGQVLDPAGGSYFVESLTAQLAEASWDFFRQVEAQGGLPEALTSGWVRARIDESWETRRRDLAHRKEPVTGVSEYPQVDETPVERKTGENQGRAETLARTRTARLAPVPTVSGPRDASLVEALVDAAVKGASLPMLSQALQRGAETTLPERFPVRRDAALFETLRDAAESLPQRPQVLLATLGPLAEHKPRTAFAENFFAAGGFAVTQAGAEGPPVSDAPAVVCLCGSDARYLAGAEAAARAHKNAGARTVLLAGRPGEHEATWRAAGVDGFIHLGCDVHATLHELLVAGGAMVEEVR